MYCNRNSNWIFEGLVEGLGLLKFMLYLFSGDWQFCS